MFFSEALEVLKSGKAVTRNGRTIVLRRGLIDISEEEFSQYHVSEDDRAAEDWEHVGIEEAPGVVTPEVVDEVLRETPGESADEGGPQ